MSIRKIRQKTIDEKKEKKEKNKKKGQGRIRLG